LTSWRIEVKPSAEKQYLRLDRKTRERIKQALRDLESEDRPLLHRQVRPLTGRLKRDYRLRVGEWPKSRRREAARTSYPQQLYDQRFT